MVVPVARGDRPSASRQNLTEEQVGLAQVGPLTESPYGLGESPIPEATFIDLYELTTDPVLDDDTREYSASAKLIYHRWCLVDDDGHFVSNSYSEAGGAVERARLESEVTAEAVWLVTSPRDANQEAEAPSMSSGDRVFVTTWGDWLVVVGVQPAGPRHFELKDNHTPGSTSTAHPQDWSGAAWVTDTAADREFEVTDPFSEYRGRGKDTYGSPHDDGSLGVAERNPLSGAWEIVRMQPNATEIEGDIYADDTLELDNWHVSKPNGGIVVDQDPAGNITFYNPHNHPDIDADMLAWIVWDTGTATWKERQKDCP